MRREKILENLKNAYGSNLVWTRLPLWSNFSGWSNRNVNDSRTNRQQSCSGKWGRRFCVE